MKERKNNCVKLNFFLLGAKSAIAMRIISFNVNGLHSIHGKSKDGTKKCAPATNCLRTLAKEQAADILCLQEIKTQTRLEIENYKDIFPHIYTNFSVSKKGYSGTAILSKEKPLRVTSDFTRVPAVNHTSWAPLTEGRVLTAEYDAYTVICVYTPNSQDFLKRLEERLAWDILFRTYIELLKVQTNWKPVIVCGDFNCALEDQDIYKPSVHRQSAGFSDPERVSFRHLLGDCSLVDTFRHLYPATKNIYSYWSNFYNSRAKNNGWRIDYILVSESLKHTIKSAAVLKDYFGSDHCPVIAEIQ
jgi:exodeoxyribonuclease III